MFNIYVSEDCVFRPLKNIRQSSEGRTVLVHGRQRGTREVHQTGGGHAPSGQHCSEACCRNKRTLCTGIWPSPMIRFQPFPVCHYNVFTDGEYQKRNILALDVTPCPRGKGRAGVKLGQWREASDKRGGKVSRVETEYVSLKWDMNVKCRDAIVIVIFYLPIAQIIIHVKLHN